LPLPAKPARIEITVHVSTRLAKILAATFLGTTLALTGVLVYTWRYIDKLKTPEPPPITTRAENAKPPVSPLLLHYRLNLPGRGEVFPALASGSPADYWPVAVLGISNTSDRPAVQTISAEIGGWSEREVKTVILGPHQDLKVNLAPVLVARAFQNQEMRRVSLQVLVAGPEVGRMYEQTRPVYLHAASDIYWGKQFSNAQFVARWVTPHDGSVLELVSRARKWMPAGRMPGYNSASKSPARIKRQVDAQSRAVFEALKKSGISYVSSIFTFGDYVGQAQRIRLPKETLSLNNANCMDVSVVFAAAMENLDMEPVVVIVPGHAFTGVRLGPQSADILYLDLTVLPKGTFAHAIRRARYWLKKTPSDEVITVDIAAARALGIYPM